MPLPPVTPKEAEEKLAAKMREMELKEKERLVEQHAAALGIPYINLKGFPISPEALVLVPKEQAFKLQTVCFLYSGPEFRLASVNPENPAIREILHQIGERLHAQGAVYLISEESFRLSFALYEKLPTPRVIVKGV